MIDELVKFLIFAAHHFVDIDLGYVAHGRASPARRSSTGCAASEGEMKHEQGMRHDEAKPRSE